MTVKEYLKQYGDAERIARRLKNEYHEELQLINAIKSPMDSDGTPHGSGISRTVEQRAMRLIEKMQRYKDAEINALQKRQQVFDLIWKVPGPKGEILYERYINLKSWDEVADAVHYSLQHIHRLHGEVLLELKDVIECYFWE